MVAAWRARDRARARLRLRPVRASPGVREGRRRRRSDDGGGGGGSGRCKEAEAEARDEGAREGRRWGEWEGGSPVRRSAGGSRRRVSKTFAVLPSLPWVEYRRAKGAKGARRVRCGQRGDAVERRRTGCLPAPLEEERVRAEVPQLEARAGA